jgi:uncharacterized membrane protein YeaQ/YmgE (transglycosylase-associated protein family)
MELIIWILFGALAGWIASMIAGTNAEQGAIGNIVVGILGALVGGALMNALGGPNVSGFNVSSLLVAILGATLLLYLFRAVARRT